MTAALAWVPCCRCGAACVSTPARWLQALCQACRPAPVDPANGSIVDTGDARLTYAKSPCLDCSAPVFHIPGWAQPRCLDCSRRKFDLDDNLWFKPIGPWHPTIARVLPGELGAILPYIRDRADVDRRAGQEAARERYRVLVPSRPAEGHEIGKGPRAAIDQLQDGVGPQVVWATYACAEDTERGELLRTIVVRVPGQGYGAWEEGAWSSGLAAHPRPHLCGSLDEWLNHVRGLDWAPPSCPRCGRLGVRVRGNGEPYKHTRADWRIPLRMECT